MHRRTMNEIEIMFLQDRLRIALLLKDSADPKSLEWVRATDELKVVTTRLVRLASPDRAAC
jgi:hypothetical protein